MIAGNKYYDTKIDIWSAGIIFLKLILVGYLSKKSCLFNVINSKALARVIMELIGEPTSVELKEMLATNNLMRNAVQ